MAHEPTTPENPPEPERHFARDVVLQHPDTRSQHEFKEGDEVPDWAVSTYQGPDLYKVEEQEGVTELDAVPGFSQGAIDLPRIEGEVAPSANQKNLPKPPNEVFAGPKRPDDDDEKPKSRGRKPEETSG